MVVSKFRVVGTRVDSLIRYLFLKEYLLTISIYLSIYLSI